MVKILTSPVQGDVPFGGHKATGLADPSAAQDAATKAYVDAVAQGLSVKASVRAASTANIASQSGLLTVDGVTLVDGDRVLAKDQTTGSTNGIWVAHSGAWTRAADGDVGAELLGAFVFVEEGATNAGSGWVQTAAAPITVGTTSLTWVQFSGAGQIVAGAGLAKAGNTLRRAASATGYANLAALPSAAANNGLLERTADGGIYESDGSAWQIVRDPSGTYVLGPTPQQVVARAMGWFILTDPQWNGGSAAAMSGLSDETAALQAILDYAAQSGTVVGIPHIHIWMPAGVVTLSNTITARHVSFEMHGNGIGNPSDYSYLGTAHPGYGTTIRWNGPAGVPMFDVSDYNRVFFHDLYFQGNYTNMPSELVLFDAQSGDGSGGDHYSGAYRCLFGEHPYSIPTSAGHVARQASYLIRYGGLNADNDQFYYENCWFKGGNVAQVAIDQTQAVVGLFVDCSFEGNDVSIGLTTHAQVGLINPRFFHCTVDLDIYSTAKVDVWSIYTEHSKLIAHVHDNGGSVNIKSGQINLTDITGPFVQHDNAGARGGVSLDGVRINNTQNPFPAVQVTGNSSSTAGHLRIVGGNIPTTSYTVQAGSGSGGLYVSIRDLPNTYSEQVLTGSAVFTASAQTPILGWAPAFVRKTADESVTSSTAAQNDDELLYPLVANGIYTFEAMIFYTGATTGDLQLDFAVPASAVIKLGAVGLAASAAATNGTLQDFYAGSGGQSIFNANGSGIGAAGTNTGTNVAFVRVRGIVVNAANAGNLQLQWAQGTSDATATVVLTNSFLTVQRVA